jgi:Spy/CpxP family protein refolding chaperone
MKKLLTTLGILLLVALMALPVLAHRRGGSGYHGDSRPGGCWQGKSPYDNLTESQMAELEKLEKKYFGDAVKLREEVRAKSAELDNLLNESEPDPNKARALQKEISNLKSKMAENKLNFRLEARTVAPNAHVGRGHGRGHGSGYHQGPCGQHGQYGYHGSRGGCGYSPCDHYGSYSRGGPHGGCGSGPRWQ